MILTLDPHDKQSLLSALDQLRQIVEESDSRRSCNTCLHMRAGMCVKWGEKPPLEYIKIGCDAWKFDVESPPF